MNRKLNNDFEKFRILVNNISSLNQIHIAKLGCDVSPRAYVRIMAANVLVMERRQDISRANADLSLDYV